ncbi:MAG: hypothetical protein LBU85_12090 [Treponema sp.]|jgi:hypothetical protein|nr:hypothetical protein [Treponema sp.]
MRKRNLLKALRTAVLPLVIAVFLTTCGDSFQPELRDITIEPEMFHIRRMESVTLKVIRVPSTGILKIDGVPAEYSVRWEAGEFDLNTNEWIPLSSPLSQSRKFVEITQQDNFSATIECAVFAKSPETAKIKAWLVNKDGEVITNDHGNYTAICTISVD